MFCTKGHNGALLIFISSSNSSSSSSSSSSSEIIKPCGSIRAAVRGSTYYRSMTAFAGLPPEALAALVSAEAGGPDTGVLLARRTGTGADGGGAFAVAELYSADRGGPVQARDIATLQPDGKVLTR